MSGKTVPAALVGALAIYALPAGVTGAPPPAVESESARYFARGGIVVFRFDNAPLDVLDLHFVFHGQVDKVPNGGEASCNFELEASSTLEIEGANGVFGRIVGGALRTRGALLLNSPTGRAVIGNLAIAADRSGALVVRSMLNSGDTSNTIFRLDSVMLDFREGERSLRLIGEVSIAEPWAATLGLPSAAGVVIGTVMIEAEMELSGSASSSTEAAWSDGAEESGGSEADRTFGPASELGVPDVLVADLQTVECYGSVDGITACAVGTTACNVGTARASWIANTNQHPVIVQNAYRLLDDRFEQIGLSWVKHGFYAVSGRLCDSCEDETDGSQLGVGCSDPYSALLNGIQTNMSPRSTVNANTGYFPYPWTDPGHETLIERRLQIRNTDLDPTLNRGARYFVQGHYVTPGDGFARTHNNNASYRETLTVKLPSGELELRILQSAQTARGQPALRAWQDVDDSVFEEDIQIPDEGLFILAAKATNLGTGVWSYEYALQNLNSDRSVSSFTVPLPDGAVVTNTGFHDVDYHSGDPYDSTDWPTVLADGSLTWSTDGYEVNENANALRWGTVYNFRFHVNAPPDMTTVTLGVFKPPPEPTDPTKISGLSRGPALAMIDCNVNRIADACDLSCEAPGCSKPCNTSDDCDKNGVPDECEPDCNGNDIPDICDVADDPSIDCNNNGLPDQCEPDEDCNTNNIQDICDIAAGTAEDCNDNSIPDGCEPYADCNGNSVQDICDIATGVGSDCNDNQIPDTCEPYTDCNDNFTRDFCDIAVGSSLDCNDNGVPDECDPVEDCNTNQTQDICDIAVGTSADCNGNDIPDECEPYEDCNDNSIRDLCDIAAGSSEDCNKNDTPDECEPYEDCNSNQVRDLCDIAAGDSLDCNADTVPDDCEITNQPDGDCNGNHLLDVCEIDQASTAPGGPFFCIENCDPDCDNNGRPDECDGFPDSDGDRLHDCDDLCPQTNPLVACVCNDVEDCCLGDFCYVAAGLPPIPPANCEAIGGVPACSPSPLCRAGCLVGDVNDDGKIDLVDIAGLLLCFGIEAGDDGHAECLRVFDCNSDGAVDLSDYQTLAGLLSNLAS